MSALFPSLKAMGEGISDKIFYLTARTVTRTVARDALDILREQGMRLKSVVLTAKEKLCICEETACDPDHCPYAKGHFRRKEPPPGRYVPGSYGSSSVLRSNALWEVPWKRTQTTSRNSDMS